MAELVSQTLPRVSCILCVLLTATAAVPHAAFPFNSQVPTVARVGQQYSFQISDSTFAPPSSDYVYSLSGQPAWLTIDSATRTLEGAPGASDAGSETFALIAADASGAAQMSCTLVISADPAPNLVGDISEQLSETANLSSSEPPVVTLLPSTPFKFEFEQQSFIDIVQRQLYYYATLADHTPLPAWLKFDAEQLTFCGTAPDLSAFPQSWVVDLIASDVAGFAGSTASFTIAVGTQQLVFVPEEQELTITAGDVVNVTVLQSELFRNNVSLSPQGLKNAVADLPDWLKLDSSTLAITGRAPNDFEAGNISVTVTDTLGNTAVSVINFAAGNSSLFNGQIGTLSAQAGQRFSFRLDDSLFSREGLDISVELPPSASWLHYDAEKRDLSGMVPSNAQPSTLHATLVAKSSGNAKRQTQAFAIDVKAATAATTSTTAVSPGPTTSSEPTAVPTSQSAQTRLNTGEIAAIVLGAIVGAGVLLLALIWCYRRRRQHDSYVQNSPRGKTISRPLRPPHDTDIVAVTVIDQDVEKNTELDRVDSHVPAPPPKIAEPPPRIHVAGIPDERSQWHGRFARISQASSLGIGEDAIRRDGNIPEWGRLSTALQTPHDSFSVPAEMARQSTHLSDISPSKRALVMQKMRAHRRSRSNVSFKRLSLGLGISGAGAAASAGVAEHSSRNGRTRHRRHRSSLGVLSPTREASSVGSMRTIRTSILSATPSDFPEPGHTRAPISESAPGLARAATATLRGAKRKSMRLVGRSDSIRGPDRSRPDSRSIEDKRNSFLAKRRGSESILFATGNRSTSASLRRNGSQSLEASLSRKGTSARGSRSALHSQNTLTKYSESSSIEPRGHLDSPHRHSRKFSQHKVRNPFVPGYPRAITQSTLNEGRGHDEVDEGGGEELKGAASPTTHSDDLLREELSKPPHERTWRYTFELSPLTAPAPPHSVAATAQNSRAPTPSAVAGASASPSRSQQWREKRERSASPLSQTHIPGPSPSVTRRDYAIEGAQNERGGKNRMSAPISLVSADSIHKARGKLATSANASETPCAKSYGGPESPSRAGDARDKDEQNWVTDPESSISSEEDMVRGAGLVIAPLGSERKGTGRSDWTGKVFL